MISLLDVSKSFCKNFLFGGIAIAILAIIIEFSKFGVAYSSYLYAALRSVYFYLFWITYKFHGEKGVNNLNVHLILGTLIFIIFVAAVHLVNKFGLGYKWSLAVGTLVFILVSYLYFKTLLYKKFN